MIETMPVGRQQQIVARMAQTRWLGTVGPACAGCGVCCGGGGAGGTAATRLAPHCSQALAPALYGWPQFGQFMVSPGVCCGCRVGLDAPGQACGADAEASMVPAALSGSGPVAAQRAHLLFQPGGAGAFARYRRR